MNRKLVGLTVGGDVFPQIEWILQPLKEQGLDYTHIIFNGTESTDELVERLKDCDYVIAADEPYNEKLLPRLPKLKFILRYGVGFDSVDLKEAQRCGVAVANMPGSNAFSVAMHAVTLMLGITHRLTFYTDNLRKLNYIKEMSDSLTGTIGLVGFGEISRQVVKLLSVFPVDIISYDPYVSAEKMAERGVKKKELDEVLGESDIVSIHVPCTPQTEKLFCADTFSKMKDGAYLINTARGKIVDEADLCEAIRSGKLKGAGLDVFEHEPLLPGNPLCEMENVILTPHIASDNLANYKHMLKLAMGYVLDFHNGKPIPSLLTK